MPEPKLNFEEPVNVDISKFVKENFTYGNYEMLEKLDKIEKNTKYRTLHDAYWTQFYNAKAENFDTDMLSMKML